MSNDFSRFTRTIIFTLLAAWAGGAILASKFQEARDLVSPRPPADGVSPTEAMALDFLARYVVFVETLMEEGFSALGPQSGDSLRQQWRQGVEAEEVARSRTVSRRVALVSLFLGDPAEARRLGARAAERKRERPAPQEDDGPRPGRQGKGSAEARLWAQLCGQRPVTRADLPRARATLKRWRLGWYETLAWVVLYERLGDTQRAAAARARLRQQTGRAMQVFLIALLVLVGGGLVGLVLGSLFLWRWMHRRVPVVGVPGRVSARVLWETLILYLFLMAVVGPLLLALGTPFSNLTEAATSSLRQVAPSLLVVEGVAALSLLWTGFHLARQRLSWDELGWRARGWFRDVLWGVGGFFALLPLLGVTLILTSLVVRLFPAIPVTEHPFVPMFAAEPSRAAVLIFFFFGSVLAPLLEETVFRGVFYTALRRHWRAWPAVLVSGAVFSLLHPQQPLGFLPLWLLGSAFAVFYELRGSVLPGVVAHALVNGASLCLLYGIVGGE